MHKEIRKSYRFVLCIFLKNTIIFSKIHCNLLFSLNILCQEIEICASGLIWHIEYTDTVLCPLETLLKLQKKGEGPR